MASQHLPFDPTWAAQAGLSEEDLRALQIISDPVAFAEAHFGWKARDYQADILRDPSLRKLVRAGRRVGKSEIIAIKCIWYSFTRGQDPDRPGSRGHVCLIVTPYEEQITSIFTRIRELIALSPEIRASIKQDKQNPQTIVFHNGSRIKGYTAGTKSGSEAAGIRGQRADWIFLDEADYLSEGDVNSVVAIALENPRIGIWASSTPSGRRQHFYRWHLNASLPDDHPDKRWKEWHFPSTVIPGWGPDMEKEFRDIFTNDAAYVREVLAEWGEESAGVYPPPLVDAAMEDYEYISAPAYPGLRIIGVDWDKFHATPEIVVLEHKEFEDGERIFEVVYRETIPRTKFTLDYTVDRIVDLDWVWKPAFIYVDRGYGDYQVERLQIIGGQAAPGEKGHGLNKRVKGVQFRQTIELREPGTGKPIRRDAKSLMVAMTRFLLERHALKFSSSDRVLSRQMLDYNSHVTPYGNVRYAPGRSGDHVLDALHLCVLGFAIEYPHLLEIQKRPEVVRRMDRSRRLLIPDRQPARSWRMPSEQSRIEESDEYYASPAIRESQGWRRVNDLREALRERRGEGMSSIFPSWGPRGPGRAPRRRSF